MRLKELGATGVKLPEVSLGTWKYRAGPEPLRYGIGLGANFIDTAEIYRTENIVGEALTGIRDKVFLATKVSGDHLRYDDVLAAADRSLKLLKTNRIDLYQIHWPNPDVPIRETMRAMEELVDSGKVKYIGVSNFDVHEMEEAQSCLKKNKIASNQVIYNLSEREIEREVIPYCERHKITILAYSPLAQGELANPANLGSRDKTEAFKKVSDATGRTAAQIALNWCLTKPIVMAIVKAANENHVKDDCEVSDWRLSPEHVELLNKAFKP